MEGVNVLNVIIAEDDFRVANLHESFLQKIKGVQVVGKALNGKETLQLIEHKQADLILLDIYLPDIPGTILIDQLREKKPDIDIIIVSASTEKEILEYGLRKGIVNYIIKPASLERFKEVIEQYRERLQLLEQNEQINQEMIHKLFDHKTTSPQNLPKGIDKITLHKVTDVLKKKKGPWSAEELGQQIGISRTTARRYLEYLVSIKLAKVEQAYGIIGRPERKYYGTFHELNEQN